MSPYLGHPIKIAEAADSCIWVLTRSINSLLPPTPKGSRASRVCRGGPARGLGYPLLAVTPHNHFSLETLSANQTTLPSSCRAAFIPLPAWPCASARKIPSATQKPALGFAWEETTAPESGPSGPVLRTEGAPQEGRSIAGFLEVFEICHIQIQTQYPRERVVWPAPIPRMETGLHLQWGSGWA